MLGKTVFVIFDVKKDLLMKFSPICLITKYQSRVTIRDCLLSVAERAVIWPWKLMLQCLLDQTINTFLEGNV